jgi:hypothetical protein
MSPFSSRLLKIRDVWLAFTPRLRLNSFTEEGGCTCRRPTDRDSSTVSPDQRASSLHDFRQKRTRSRR